MAKTRQDLQNYLKTLVANVYFQPPENVKLIYPCIIYSRTRIDGTFANNDVYRYAGIYVPSKATKTIKKHDQSLYYNSVVHPCSCVDYRVFQTLEMDAENRYRCGCVCGRNSFCADRFCTF